MHELSLCSAIAETAIEHADGRAVNKINLRIGHFRQVIPETLQFCWEMRPMDGVLEHSELVIDYVPAVLQCNACGTSTVLSVPVLVCGNCASADAELSSGEEFLIESIDLVSARQQAPTPNREEVR